MFFKFMSRKGISKMDSLSLLITSATILTDTVAFADIALGENIYY